MTSQCLGRRIDTLEKLSGELGAWQLERNDIISLCDILADYFCMIFYIHLCAIAHNA
jgi:hypothetical protein